MVTERRLAFHDGRPYPAPWLTSGVISQEQPRPRRFNTIDASTIPAAARTPAEPSSVMIGRAARLKQDVAALANKVRTSDSLATYTTIRIGFARDTGAPHVVSATCRISAGRDGRQHAANTQPAPTEVFGIRAPAAGMRAPAVFFIEPSIEPSIGQLIEQDRAARSNLIA